MGAPPIGKRKSGRVNPEGIGVFYLTSDMETALHEVRASAFDFVSVGKFQLKKDIRVVNISALNEISPVLYSSGLESLAANISLKLFFVFGNQAKYFFVFLTSECVILRWFNITIPKLFKKLHTTSSP